ncbi:MAG: hypothetical protein J7L34_01530 [Thermotogaceae bacterium]|nr:hypothetical protein [Thermotogaceae bacterium]
MISHDLLANIVAFIGILIFMFCYAEYFVKGAEWEDKKYFWIDEYIRLKAYPEYRNAPLYRWKKLIKNLKEYDPELAKLAEEDMKKRFASMDNT